MNKTTILKNLLLDDEILAMPGAYDALSAKIIEKAGFKAIQCSGYGIAASMLGMPDIGVLSMADMLEQTRRICAAVDIPVMADGDTGFGNAVNTYYTVRAFEAAGAAGINLEDQVFPKRCGHMEGKQVIPLEEMVGKIKAACDGRVDKDFVINARTDAIAAVGVEEAIKRANAYAEAGATIIFVEAMRSVEEIKYVIENVNAPVSVNLVDFGKTPVSDIRELEKLGAKRVSIPVSPVFAAAKGVMNAMEILMEENVPASKNHPELLTTFSEFTDLMGLPKYKEMEEKYLPKDILEDKYNKQLI